MHDELKIIYNDVKEWLKFAEAKNAGFLAFNGVVIFGYYELLDSKIPLVANHIYAVYIGIICCLLSTLLLLISFFLLNKTVFNINKKRKVKKVGNTTNTIFYGSISENNRESYLENLKEKYNITDDRKNADLIDQILLNSKITFYKLEIFKYSLYLAILALTLPLLT